MAVGNSVIGVVLLLLGGDGGDRPVVVLVLSLLGLAGAGARISARLPELEAA